MRNYISLIVAFFLFMPITANSSACYLESGNKACFTIDNKKMVVGKTYTDCKKIKVRCEDGKLCYINQSGGIDCLLPGDYKVGDPININQVSSSDNTNAILQALADIFMPQPKLRHGLKSLKTTKELIGFPDGYVLMPNGDLSFVSLDESTQAVNKFMLWEEGTKKPLFVLDNTTEVVVIPRDYLKSDKKYRWEAASGKNRFKGGFTIESVKYQKEFEQELSEIMANSDVSGISQHIIRASLAKKYGYSFDYIQSIHYARKAMNGGGGL